MASAIREGARQIFLIGPPRSGTTLMTRLLNSHPQVLLTNETAVFMQLASMSKKSRIGRKAGILFGKNSGNEWADVLDANADRLFREFYDKLAEGQGKSNVVFWGEKHPHIYEAIDYVASLYPDAFYVYAIRDPRDSACSIAEMNKVSIAKGLSAWDRFSSHYEKFVATLPPERLVTVKYEDLVADYIGQTARLFESMGLDFHDKAKRYVDEYADVDSHSGVAQRGADEGVLKQMDARLHTTDYKAKSLNRWQREFSDEDLKLAIKLHGAFLRKYGYEIGTVGKTGGPKPRGTLKQRLVGLKERLFGK